MAVPNTALDVMTPAEFRWELRLQPSKPEDSVLLGAIRRSIAWVVENTGMPVLPVYETYQVNRSIYIDTDRKYFIVGIPHVVNIASVVVDNKELLAADRQTEVFDSYLLRISRRDKAAFLKMDSVIKMTVWRGIHIGTDTMENIRSLIAAIGREIFDGLDFRKSIKMTLTMGSIVDRLALHSRPFEGVTKVGDIIAPAVPLPQELRPPAAPVTQLVAQYGLAATDGSAYIGATQEVEIGGETLDVNFPATTDANQTWAITLPNGYIIKRVDNTAVGGVDVTNLWSRVPNSNVRYYSGPAFTVGTQYSVRFTLGIGARI